MRIAQIVLSDATEYERKSQRADQASLAERHEIIVVTLDEARRTEADIAHVYAGRELPYAPFMRFPLPYVASANVRPSRWRLRRPAEPRAVVSPLGETPLPEVVEEAFFSRQFAVGSGQERKTTASFARESTRNVVEQTMARIHRFRDDVSWRVFEAPPTPEDLAGVDVWVDPAVEETDYDGFVAEALVVGLPVVASRTAINSLRLEKGRTGFLVPLRDPNEMTHAILGALFRSEAAEPKKEAARQTASKFRARQRLRVLTRLYETLI